MEEEERLKFMKGRLRANYDFDDEAFEDEQGLSMGGMLALLKYPFYTLFTLIMA